MNRPSELTKQATALAERTQAAYSFDNYGMDGWRGAARILLKRGYTPREAEAILRSKWTRWAADGATDRPRWRFGQTNGADLARFLDLTTDKKQLQRDVAQLVLDTFGPEDTK
jgi:hypothetical protein